ncbi:MAG: ABC transporter ATP-binding protein [Erysipelotrichaceae bacterium]|nr:ABC transporter ATP-binding protein [Erysipelotrichaceae bacterium]
MILRVVQLCKNYGKTKGIEDLSLELNDGEIFGLIGPNGAGKSTTIRSIMNMINKSYGEVYFNDQLLDKNNIEAKKLIGYLPSEVFLYEDMSVKQMLDYHASFFKEDLSERRKELVKLLNVDEKKKIEDLSLGNLKKVGIILALMHNPKLLILDEPSSGLDPIMQQTFYELLLQEKAKGTTIIYSTHILSEVSKICDRVGIIKDSHLVKIEDVDSLNNNRLTFIKITSADNEKIKEALDLETYELGKNTIRFKYDKDVNSLLSVLTNFNIDRMLIEEPTIEEIFMHYYR